MQVDAVRGERVLIGDSLEPATLLIRHGRIDAIQPIELPVSGTVIDAPQTAYVLPGIVDTHVHVNEPGRTEWEGFVSATTAAAAGGVTTFLDMPLNALPPTTTLEALTLKQESALGELAVDVGFWGGAVPGNVPDLEPMWDAGVFGFKCFLSPSGVDEFPALQDHELREALAEVARLDALMLVHAEDADVLERAPAPPSRAYRDFLLSRPDDAETAAVRRLLDAARETGARVHVVHLSSARALDLIADARADGVRVSTETCPHYLCLTAEEIPDAAPQFKCCPPIRDAGNQEQLWQGLLAGVIDTVVTDHSPATAAEKNRGGGDLQQAWGGIAGLQVGFTAVAHAARKRGIRIDQVSRWMSRRTADLVGLAGKGRIEVGADADLVIYDANSELVVDARRLAHRNPISAYDGQRFSGRVVRTLVRGTTVDAEHPDHGWGRQLRRPS